MSPHPCLACRSLVLLLSWPKYHWSKEKELRDAPPERGFLVPPCGAQQKMQAVSMSYFFFFFFLLFLN